METRIIKAVFGASKSIVAPKRFKNDWGQVLELVGIELPQVFEAHFSNSRTGTAKKRVGQDNRVEVPAEYFKSGADIFCWVMVHDTVSDGRTMYTVRIPIEDRGTATDEEPTPVQQDVIEQAIAVLNSAVEKTAQDVESADASAQGAKADADRAETARDTAEGYVVDAQNYAQQAQASANSAASSASTSAQSASTAQQIKTDVQGLVSNAQSAAGASAQSALESAQSASQASASATSASQSAETASTKASEASNSAQTASTKATEASGYASTASTKASEASQSASSASGYATQAGQAKTAAETAQGLAEQAQSDAESAKDDAESARDEAQQVVSGISGKVEQIDQNTADIASLEADRYKAYVTDTATGAVASFPDGADDVPMKDVKVQIEPAQDLHGQDAPYPAGGGKNKLLLDVDNIKRANGGYDRWSGNTYTTNGITFTLHVDEAGVIQKITANGTASEAESALLYIILDASVVIGASVIVTIPGVSVGGLKYDNTWIDLRTTSTAVENVSTLQSLWVRINRGVTVNNVDCSPMIRLATETDATFAPYSNICPISGWTGAQVVKAGKNLFDGSTVTTTTPNNWGVSFVNNVLTIEHKNSYSSGTPLYMLTALPSRTYVVSYTSTQNKRCSLYNGSTYIKLLENGTTFSTGEGDRIIFSANDNTTNTFTNFQLELGSVATAFAPYATPTTYSITFPTEAGTVYGGTLDVTTGVLTVDRAMVDLGTLTWFSEDSVVSGLARADFLPFNTKYNQIPVCSKFKSVSARGFREFKNGEIGLSNSEERPFLRVRYQDLSGLTDTEIKTTMSGVQFVYELATPIIYQLTPAEIRSLLGQNNVWAEAGDSTVEYRADTKLYIQKKITEAVNALA